MHNTKRTKTSLIKTKLLNAYGRPLSRCIMHRCRISGYLTFTCEFIYCVWLPGFEYSNQIGKSLIRRKVLVHIYWNCRLRLLSCVLIWLTQRSELPPFKVKLLDIELKIRNAQRHHHNLHRNRWMRNCVGSCFDNPIIQQWCRVVNHARVLVSYKFGRRNRN